MNSLHARSTDDSILYFAYGSNMLTERLRQRTPSCRPLGTAQLPGYRLKFHKRSTDGSGKCDAFHTGDPSHVVIGVLFHICSAETQALDIAESLGSGYERRRVIVNAQGSQERVEAELYIAMKTAIDASLKPYRWYKSLVTAGAREHGLSAAYRAHLENHPEIDDPDTQRHQDHMQLMAPAP
ncbi:gamma-glutamylcyclotransferase [Stieleria sp. TO1_6]|uniref:gamma-glutamylcyclotransferase family protein n=1 Tax=Stieleria tagensis TaxID=2956795 RepID=UPI00209B0B46|nr:gamma-glutamylcyclotransferase family protein [Stieleria tagensis]MCO8124682.1 gamma-glutamylcyclotransferase [Stieleria tagensis]